MLVLTQLSDLHLDGGERRAARAERIMDHLNGLAAPSTRSSSPGTSRTTARPRSTSRP
ncbi:hypothetical protein ACFQHO_05080 [Actinomadura yumaensis]|uniref:hypothetical protein n=1 Tax=Actinomadura TaxID=1988 RepID=UPI002815631A|nr:hypothetical protein [Actinomadura sp. J1-007]